MTMGECRLSVRRPVSLEHNISAAPLSLCQGAKGANREVTLMFQQQKSLLGEQIRLPRPGVSDRTGLEVKPHEVQNAQACRDAEMLC